MVAKHNGLELAAVIVYTVYRSSLMMAKYKSLNTDGSDTETRRPKQVAALPTNSVAPKSFDL
jgi:hypothetical protein